MVDTKYVVAGCAGESLKPVDLCVTVNEIHFTYPHM